MKDNILLSFIIPVYNVEDYLRECVDSILIGMTDECEIILVNDGSKDSSGDICDQYSKNDSRIQVLHKDNGGLSSARNAGIALASGKYVTFVDSDDKIYPESISEIIKWILNNETDICFLQTEKFYPDGSHIDHGECISHENLRSVNREEAITYLASRPKYPGSAWAKLYKRDFLKEFNLHFPYDRRYSEDLGFILDCIINARSFDALDNPFYQYRQKRQGSITNTFKIKNFNDLLLFISESDEKLNVRENDDSLSKKIMSFVSYEYVTLLFWYCMLPKEDRKKTLENMKSYVWTLDYAESKKTRAVSLACKVFGVRVTSFLLKQYKRIAEK